MTNDNTVYNNLKQKIEGKPNHIIMDVAGENVSTLEFLDNINNVSKSIDMLNVKVNQPITVIDDTTESFINLFYGSNKYGSIFATPGFPIFSDSPQEFTEEIGSDTLFISKRFYEALENNPSTKGIINKIGLRNIVLLPSDLTCYRNLKYNASIDDILNKGFKLYKEIDYIDYTLLLQDAKKYINESKINEKGGNNDIAYLFTSGSTGKPKTLKMPNSSFNNMCEKLEAQGYDFNPNEDKYFASLPCNYVTPLETLNLILQLGVPVYVNPLIDFSKIADIYYKSDATIIMCPPSLLDPLYIMITKNKKEKMSFILEMIKQAPKDKKSTKEEKIERLKLVKKMFENRKDVKYVFSAGEPLTRKLEMAYKNENIEILNCTGSGETGPTAINGISLKGDSYRVIDPNTLKVIYSSENPNKDIIIRGLLENKKSSSSFNGYLNNEELTKLCYTNDGEDYWKYYDIVEVRNGIMKTLCRLTDAIIKKDKIITPSDITTIILEDNRVSKCEAYPINISDENRMLVDIIIKEKYRKKFNDIINIAHCNIQNRLGKEYLPFGYKDNKNFQANPYTGKLDREIIRKNKVGYISAVTNEEIEIIENDNYINKLLKKY